MTKIKKIDYNKYPHISKESKNFISFSIEGNVTKCVMFGTIDIYDETGNIVDRQTEFPYEMQKQMLEQSLVNQKKDRVKLKKALSIVSNKLKNNKTEPLTKCKKDEIFKTQCNISANLLAGYVTKDEEEAFYDILADERISIQKAYFYALQEYITKNSEGYKNTKKLLDCLQKPTKYLDQPTYRSLLRSTKGGQKGNLMEIERKDRENALNLLANLIGNDNSLSKEEKANIFEEINKVRDEQELAYEINRWLGKKLNKQERRLLRAIRRIAYKKIQEDSSVESKKLFIYELEVPMSEIYDEWGLEQRPEGGYYSSQTKIIKDLFFGESGRGLYEDMLFKHKTITRTRYILQVQEISRDVYKEKQNKKEKQIYGIKIVLPGFLFVFDEDIELDKDIQSFIYQDTEGFKRFMRPKGMAQDKYAFELAEYLEEILSSSLEQKIVNLETIVKESGLENLYNTRQSKAITKINKLLDKMVAADFLINDWKFDKKGGKYNQGQYELHNIRSGLFASKKTINKGKNNKVYYKK